VRLIRSGDRTGVVYEGIQEMRVHDVALLHSFLNVTDELTQGPLALKWSYDTVQALRRAAETQIVQDIGVVRPIEGPRAGIGLEELPKPATAVVPVRKRKRK